MNIRRFASLRGMELRVFAAMNAIADAVYFSGLKDEVIRITFVVNAMQA